MQEILKFFVLDLQSPSSAFPKDSELSPGRRWRTRTPLSPFQSDGFLAAEGALDMHQCEVERRCHARILSVSIINLLTYYYALYVSFSPCALARSAVAGKPFRKQFLEQALCCLRLRLERGLSSFTLSLPAGRGNTTRRCRCPRPVRSITDPPTQHGEAATTAEGVFLCSISPAHLLHHAVVDSPRCSSIDCQVNTNSCNAVAGGLEGLMTSG